MLIFRSQSIGLYCHYDKVCLIGVLYNDGIKREGERDGERSSNFHWNQWLTSSFEQKKKQEFTKHS